MKWLKKLLHRQPVHSIQIPMNLHSQENLDAMIDEYKFLGMTLAALNSKAQYRRENRPDLLAATHSKMTIRRLELEIMIEALTDYLN